MLQKVTEGASILGLFVMGALVSKWTTINVPLVVSRVTTNGKTTVTTVQNILDQLLPGLLALVLTLVVSKLLKKNISPIAIIFILFPIALIFAENSMYSLQSVAIIAAFPIGFIILLIVISFFKDANKYLQEKKENNRDIE